MPYLMHYDRTTGAIRGVWSAAERTLLLAQMRETGDTEGYLLLEDLDVTPSDLQARYDVVDGALRERQQLEIQATPQPFPADGTTPCVITVVPFVPCTLLVDSAVTTWSLPLEQADDPLRLTADTPQVVTIQVQPAPGLWALPLTVEAV